MPGEKNEMCVYARNWAHVYAHVCTQRKQTSKSVARKTPIFLFYYKLNFMLRLCYRTFNIIRIVVTIVIVAVLILILICGWSTTRTECQLNGFNCCLHLSNPLCFGVVFGCEFVSKFSCSLSTIKIVFPSCMFNLCSHLTNALFVVACVGRMCNFNENCFCMCCWFAWVVGCRFVVGHAMFFGNRICPYTTGNRMMCIADVM